MGLLNPDTCVSSDEDPARDLKNLVSTSLTTGSGVGLGRREDAEADRVAERVCLDV